MVTGKDNRNQVLLARSTNGGASFTAPVKVGDYYELPDCDTYQGVGADPGRACVPEKGASHNSVFRASNYPIGAVDPTDPNRVVVTFGSYINRNSNENRGCTPTGFAADGINTYTGVKDGGCNNDILYSVSGNGGGSFSGGDDRPAAAAGDHRRSEAGQHRPVLAGRRVHLDRDARRVATTTGPTVTTTPPATPTSPSRRRTTGSASPTSGPPPPRCRRRPSSPGSSTATTPE